MSNGYSADVPLPHANGRPHLAQSESELSDAVDLPTATIDRSHEPRREGHSDDDAIHEMATSEVDEDEDKAVSADDDADFGGDSPVSDHQNGVDQEYSSSDESRRPGKRKKDVNDDEYMKENPELYGLRRSVSAYMLLNFPTWLTRCYRVEHDLIDAWYDS